MIQTADQIIQLDHEFIETIFVSPVSFEPQKSPDSFSDNCQGFPGTPVPLLLLTHLEDIKLQIIGLVRRPANGVVAALGAEIDLAETFVGAVGGFPDGFGETLRIHELGAGAGAEKASVLHPLPAAQIDLP